MASARVYMIDTGAMTRASHLLEKVRTSSDYGNSKQMEQTSPVECGWWQLPTMEEKGGMRAFVS